MNKLFKHFIVILAGVLMLQSLVSCLENNDETEIITYSDSAITSFSLGTLNRYVKTKKKYPDSNGVYQDSTYKTTYNASNIKFSIDQYKKEIYNKDSLHTFTDTTATICNISAKNSGYLYLRRLKCDSLSSNFNYPLPTSSNDTLIIYSSNDSINFTENPRELFVLSSDGIYLSKYTVKVNVHKEDSLKMTWPTKEKANVVDGLKHMTCGLKAVSLRDEVVVFGSNGTSNIILATNNTTENWHEIEPNIVFGTEAYQNLAVCKDNIYALEASGSLMVSADAKNWSATNLKLSRLYGASSNSLYGLDIEGRLVSVNVGDMTVTTEGPADIAASLPTEQYTVYTQPMTKGSGAECVVIAGLKDGKPTLFTKTEELSGNIKNKYDWFSLNTESEKVMLPSCGNLCVASYGSHTIALTDNTLYTSEDKGLVWRKRYFLYAPSGLDAAELANGATMTVDSKNTLWIICPATGRVWHGKLNGLAWKTTLNR